MTWNPIRAALKGFQSPEDAKRTIRSGTFCTRISPGCTHCYASTINKRFGNGLEFTVPNLEKVEFFIDERILAEPLKQKKPCTIFVGDMFDLFHEKIPGEMIAEVLRVAWKLPRHTFQFLTKRADRMQRIVTLMLEKWGDLGEQPRDHMWFGVSVEDQQRSSERVPFLQATPAAISFLSVEPQLEEVSPDLREISWVICGGESGPGARPFNLAWAESLLAQCEAAHVPFFMKQLGSKPERDGVRYIGNFDGYRRHEVTGKGGEMHQWPPSLRVREFPRPAVREVVTA